MEIVKIETDGLDKALRVSHRTLLGGGVVAFPTETFYALGVRIDDEAGLRRIYELKKRPSDKAMPIAVGDLKMLNQVSSEINSSAIELIEKHWPGPLTILLPSKSGLSEMITKDGHVAVRIPGKSFAFDLVRHAGFPVTATSANPSGQAPAETAEDVVEYFGDSVDLVIDGGATPGGEPSTIVDTKNNIVRVLRHGACKI